MRSMDFVLTIALLYPGAILAQSICPDGQTDCQYSQTADLKSVLEVVGGTSDGINRVYHLNNEPSSKVALRLFRNGIELNPSSDYTIQGKTINLTGQALQVAGDVYEAAYATDVSTEEKGPVPSRERVSPEGNRELLSRYLQRSLDQSLHDPSALLAVPPSPPPQQPQQASAPSSNVADLQSMRMLTTAMSYRPKDEGVVSRKAKHNRSMPAMAQGAEGLGDKSFYGPFDLLAVAPGSLNEDINSIDLHSSSSRAETVAKRPKSHTLRSLNMLQQRMSDSQSH